MIGFSNPWALYGLSVLVPVIVLYLLRPKPKEIKIPSLMFILKIEERRRFRSLFRRIIRDPLLLLQILAICFIVLSMANPYYTSEVVKKVRGDVAIIIDSSASMKAGNPSRFSEAVAMAESIISSLEEDAEVSVIVAEEIPIVFLKKGSREGALDVIEELSPKDTRSGIGNAILFAKDLIGESKVPRSIYAISDFSHYIGSSPLAAERIATTNGISTRLLKVRGGKENMGIVGLSSGRRLGDCVVDVIVRNYGTENKSAEVGMVIDGEEVQSEKVEIGGGSSEILRMRTKCSRKEHKIVVALKVQDDLQEDNTAYCIIPEEMDFRVLLIRERGSSNYLKFALGSMKNLEVDETYPPVYPSDYGGYDIVIFQEAKEEDILPGTFAELKRFAEKGGIVIVVGFEGLSSIEQSLLYDMLPVDVVEVSTFGGKPDRISEHEIWQDVDLRRINIRKYLYGSTKEKAVSLAEINGAPLLSAWNLGSGRVVYVGISPDPEWSDFYSSPSFPVFWYQLINWVGRGESVLERRNFKTGEGVPIFSNSSVYVKKPSGERVEGRGIVMDEAGFYYVEEYKKWIAASLLDQDESDIGYEMETGKGGKIQEGGVEEKREEEVNKTSFMFAVVAVALLLGEWIYYKRRGSL